MALSDEESPLGLAQEVEQLLKLPQHLCKQRGICCRVATFKGSLSLSELEALAKEDDIQGEMARDFLSVFLPYASQTEVIELAPEFVARVKAKALEKGQNTDAIQFFHCKYVLEDGRCGVHEDRPVGCRMYPFPHENTIFHPGCGFEKQAHEQWERIKEILTALGMSTDLQQIAEDAENTSPEE